MKIILCVLTIFFTLSSNAQLKKVKWTLARIDLGDTVLRAEVALDNSFFEGTLLVKDGEKIMTLPPQKVESFTIFLDSSKSHTFRTVKTIFLKSRGVKHSFLMERHTGKTFSLYSKFIPDVKSKAFYVPAGGGVAAYGFFSYLKDEEVVFVKAGDLAHQISIPTNRSAKKDRLLIDEYIFFSAFGSHADKIRLFAKKHSINVRSKRRLSAIIDYANTLGEL